MGEPAPGHVVRTWSRWCLTLSCTSELCGTAWCRYSARGAGVGSSGKMALCRIPVIAGSPGRNAVLDIKPRSMAFENERMCVY